MTPKEKAEELIEKFKVNDYDWIAQGNIYCVKQHALICVDEILKTEDYFCSFNNVGGMCPWDYWEQVKEEINKL